MDQSKLEETIAIIEIQQVMARYSRGIDRHDFELAKSAYHPDATDNHGPIEGNAHEVMDMVDMGLSNMKASQHRLGQMLVEVNGDRAAVETYFLSYHLPKDATHEENVHGRYVDLFERRDGEWKIAKRKVVVDASFNPEHQPWPSAEKFIQGRRDKSDPSYEIFSS